MSDRLFGMSLEPTHNCDFLIKLYVCNIFRLLYYISSSNKWCIMTRNMILARHGMYVQTHSVWKSQKKSYSKLRAKRATFPFWVDKGSLKMVNFGEFLKIWSLLSNSVTRQVNFNWTKIGENAKIETLKCDILDDFQTLWKVCVY